MCNQPKAYIQAAQNIENQGMDIVKRAVTKEMQTVLDKS